MTPSNYNTGKYADRAERVKRAQIAGRAGKSKSPWSRGPMVDNDRARRIFAKNKGKESQS